MIVFLLAPLSSLISLAFAYYYFMKVKRLSRGTEKMIEIQEAIQEGSYAFLRRQYSTISIIGLIVAALIYLAIDLGSNQGKPLITLSFVIGVAFSLIAGAVAMLISAFTNARTTEAAKKGKREALRTAFDGGLIMGLVVVSMSLLGISILYLTYNAWLAEIAPEKIIGFAFGASFAALFAQLGGGIYTKSADVGADLVGKVEQGIPEDDPRNPAVIADQVGDSVGDCAGRGADLFESITGENIGGMIVGLFFYATLKGTLGHDKAIMFVIFPLVARGFGLLATLVSAYFMNLKETDKNPMTPMKRAFNLNALLAAIVFIVLIYFMLDKNVFFMGAALAGIILAVVIMYITDYYTGDNKPVKHIAESSTTGSATNIISGLSVGMESTALPVVSIITAIMISYVLGYSYGLKVASDPVLGTISPFKWGIYATTVATMAMLSVTAMILAMDGFGPIADNAGGIAEMSGLGEEIRASVDALDAVGNTTKALAKGYGMASAGLAAILLFEAYLEEFKNNAFRMGYDMKNLVLNDGSVVVNITRPEIMMGVFIGVLLPFIFTAFSMGAVGRAAKSMIEEVRRQFHEIPGILEGTEKPQYGHCVDVSTKAALKEMVMPSLLVVLAPIVTGIIFGPASVGGFLVGATFSGLMLGMTLNNAGGAWDNAKKYIEAGNLGGKGSEAHKAAVVGDTVGDPAKDTSGPSIHVLVKLVNTVALVFVPVFIWVHQHANIYDWFRNWGII